MRIALISDVHANLPALQAVLNTLEKENPDLWICLGDIVGYGPHPAECIAEIRSRNMISVLGNHDAGVAGLLSVKHFREPNRKLIEMTKTLLSEEDRNWLAERPLIAEGDAWLAVHSSPVNPDKWEYLQSALRIREILQGFKKRFCFAGHTHRPGMVSDTIGHTEIDEEHHYFINPGSVGQSRDGDERASCGILDLSDLTYRNIRVPYNIERAVQDLKILGFSDSEAARLIKPRMS